MSEASVVIEPEDMYSESDDPPSGIAGYSLSFFVFPGTFLTDTVGDFGTGDTLELVIPMNVYRGLQPFRVKLARMSEQVTLGVICNAFERAAGASDGLR